MRRWTFTGGSYFLTINRDNRYEKNILVIEKSHRLFTGFTVSRPRWETLALFQARRIGSGSVALAQGLSKYTADRLAQAWVYAYDR